MLVLSLLVGGASYWQMQQALRWWFNQTSSVRVAQANQIQNGLMQDLFALRLSLDLSPDLSQPVQTAAETLHQQLSDLSAALSPPYLNESLPLAMQFFLQQWQTAHPRSQLQLDLPARWTAEPPERHQIVLTTLETLLRLADTPGPLSIRLSVGLSDQAGSAELTVRLTYCDETSRSAATHAKELRYLRDCFRCLMPGWCSYQAQPLTDIWQFRWSTNPVESRLENPLP